MLFPHYERIVVLVELEAAATGLFASAAFFDDDLGAEVRPGAYLVFEDRDVGAFLILADNTSDLAVGAPQAAKFFVGEDEQIRHFKLVHCFGY